MVSTRRKGTLWEPSNAKEMCHLDPKLVKVPTRLQHKESPTRLPSQLLQNRALRVCKEDPRCSK